MNFMTIYRAQNLPNNFGKSYMSGRKSVFSPIDNLKRYCCNAEHSCSPCAVRILKNLSYQAVVPL